MAVIDKVPGLEVQIVAQDQPLREHQDRFANIPAKTSEYYIEAQSHSQFEIHYAFRKPFPIDRAVSMIVTIDGKDVDEPLIRSHELLETKGHTSSGPISHVDSGWEVQKYQFSPLDIREGSLDSVSEKVKEALKDTSIISCSFYFLDNPKPNRRLRGARKAMNELPTVDEKAVKGDALSHQAMLSLGEPTEEVEYYDAEYANNGQPFATFHFYYRSLSALKDLHIIKRTPEPLQLLNNDDTPLGQLNREQLEAIVRRLREQEEARLRVKRERSSDTLFDDDDDANNVRRGNDPDFIELRSVDLRARRRAKRVKQLPKPGSEVIEMDD